MYRRLFGLCLTLIATTVCAGGAYTLEEGAYSLKGKDGQPKHFSVRRADDKWEIKSDDPTFLLNAVRCNSNCDFLVMDEMLQEKVFPSFFRRDFVMNCIGNGVFALCKMTDKPLQECSNPAVKPGEACRIGPPKNPGKPLYGMFALFAPTVPPITVTRLNGND